MSGGDPVPKELTHCSPRSLLGLLFHARHRLQLHGSRCGKAWGPRPGPGGRASASGQRWLPGRVVYTHSASKTPDHVPTLHSGGTSVSQRRCRGAEAPGRGSLWVGWGVDVVFSSLSLEHGRGLSRAQPGPVTCSAYSQFSSPSTTVLALHGSCPELALGEEVSPAAAMTRVTGAWGEASTGATAPDYGWKAGAQGGARAQGGCGQGPGAAGRCPGLAGVPCRLHAPCTLRSLWLVL